MSWRKLPLAANAWPALEDNPLPYAGMVTSLPEEHDYECRVLGELPPLEGTLFRVGPGRYDRGPDRKRMMLDGDGMIQALTLSGGRARFRNRYVRTTKYLEEQAAGRFLYPTFSTHGSGAMRYNLGLTLANQANTTVIEWANRVWAFDEGQVPYELTPDLETLRETAPDPQQPRLRYWAHWKLDAHHRQLHLLAVEHGPRSVAHVVTMATDGTIVDRRHVTLPRSVYFHDWFVSENHFAFLLHPAFLSLGRMLKVSMARETFSVALRWRPEKGSVLLVVDRRTGDTLPLPASASWMWHSVNSFEADGNLVCDFIGSDIGGNLGDEDSVWFKIMRGERASLPIEPYNTVRRYRVDLRRGTLEERIVDGSANYELPCVSATERGRPYSKAYMIRADAGEVFARGLCQLDAETLTTRKFLFDAGEFGSEPVVLDALDGARGTHLVTQVYDSRRKKSYFAVIEEARFEAGPVARIELDHHVPLSFHGYWAETGLG